MVEAQQGRRDRILGALMRITAEQGLDAVSVREVATEAGVSIGAVQHHCRSKEEMLLMTFTHVADRVRARVEQAARAGGPHRTVLRRVLHQLLPLDEQRRVEALVYLSFATKSATSPPLAEVQNGVRSEMAAGFTERIGRAQGDGDVAAVVGPDRAASTLVALLDGLTLHVLTGALTRRSVKSLLDEHLDQLFCVDTR